MLFQPVVDAQGHRGAADNRHHQQYAVIAQEVQAGNTAGGNEQLLHQQGQAHAILIAHEQRPAHSHQEQGVNVGPDAAGLQLLQKEDFFDGQQNEVIDAPEDEVPVGTVPDTGQSPDHEHVEDLTLQTPAITAQGDVHIFPEPAGQCHVPAPPEIGDAAGDVGHVEVHGEVKAQHLAHADAHQRVTGEVKIKLQGIGQQTQPDQRRAGIFQANTGAAGSDNMLVVVGADDVVPQFAYSICNQNLFGQTEHKQADALLDLLEAVAVFINMQLGCHIAVFYDGAGNQLGEHDHIRAEIDDIVLGFYIPAVYVDGIAHGLEGVEADAER